MRSLAVALLAVAAPAAAESFAGWLPEGALYYVGTADLGRLRERATEGPLGALWADPALRPVRLALEGRFAGRQEGDVTVLDLFALVEGEVAVARVRGATLGFVDCGEKARLFAALLLRYHAQQARDLAIVETEEPFLGHAIRVRRKAGTREVQAHAWAGSRVCFSDDVGVLREVLRRRADGGAPPPGLRVPREADVFAWVAPEYWLGGWEEAPLLGLDRVRALRARITLEPEGIRSEAELEIEGEPKGLVRLLARAVPGLGPPALLPADTGAACTVSLDYGDVLEELLRIRPDLRPALEAETRALRDAFGIDLRRDVLGALGDELTLAFLPPSWSDLGSDSVPDARAWGDPVIVQELARPEALDRFLRRIAGPPRDGIWILPGERFGAVAVIDGNLVLATRPRALRRLGAPGPGVRAGEAFAAAHGRVPGARAVFAFADPLALSGPALERRLLKRRQPRLGPVLDALDRHLGASAFALSRDAEGLRLTWFVGLR